MFAEAIVGLLEDQGLLNSQNLKLGVKRKLQEEQAEARKK
jgi:hypothetical protein